MAIAHLTDVRGFANKNRIMVIISNVWDVVLGCSLDDYIAPTLIPLRNEVQC